MTSALYSSKYLVHSSEKSQCQGVFLKLQLLEIVFILVPTFPHCLYTDNMLLFCHPEALTLLGNFYINNGQRTRLPEDLANEILGYLRDAQSAVQAAV